MYKITRLGKIANITTGFPFKGDRYTDVGTRVLRGENVTIGSLRWDSIKCWPEKFDQEEKYSLKANDIVIGMDGSRVGKNRAIVSEEDLPLLLAQRVACVRANNLSDQNFLYYLIRSDKFENYVSKIQTGSSIPHISLSQIEDFPVAFPPLETQKSIGKILRVIDSKIELNNKINAELEAMAKTIYDYWFVQFDFPNAKGKPYKSSGGKMVWNEELKREIPDGWENGTIGNIANLVRGVTYGGDEIMNENEKDVVPILRATNINGNVIDLNSMVYVPSNKVSENQILKKYDILITMSSGSKDHIGKNGLFYFEQDVAFGAFCAKIVAKGDFKFYLYSFTQSDFMFTTIKNECLGTNINNLNSTLVKNFKLVLPSIEIIKSFNNIVSPIFEKVGNNLIENQQLSSLRDWLLPMLMNGQVKVKDVEEELGIAAEGKTKYSKSK